jgi:hypothetical protein
MTVFAQEPASRSQEFLRDVNEKIAGVGFVQDDQPVDFVCECSSLNCVEKIALTLAQYQERKTRGPIVVAGHQVRG